MSKLLRVFPGDESLPRIVYCQGITLTTDSGLQIKDFTGGGTSHMILGWNHPKINEAIAEQLKRFSHVDYKTWNDPNCESLAELLVAKAAHGLDRVYLCGNSGGEACEAAIKMSYQWHCAMGQEAKQWVVSRDQSYHGSSSDAMSLGDRPNLELYRPILPPKRARIAEHNPIRHRLSDESLHDYAIRSANALEDKIIELGPDNVAAFIGETMMGGLVGDVPPVPGYWQRIREICDTYHVHLILDEVYCGTGVSGKVFCCDWDGVSPDFLYMGKTLAAGYAPVSAVMTSQQFEDVVVRNGGRLQHSTTHQAYSLGVAAANAVQRIVSEEGFLNDVCRKGQLVQQFLSSELGRHPFYREVRGRGLRQSFEYQCADLAEFSTELGKRMLLKYQSSVSSKWHRLSVTPALNVCEADLTQMLERYVVEFRSLASAYC